MSLRLASLRHLARASSRSYRPLSAVHLYATLSDAPKPSQNTPPPAGLESLFGGNGKSTRGAVAPQPAGAEPSGGPSLPKKPDVGLPGLEGDGKDGKESQAAEEEAARRPKLSDFKGNAGKKAAMGGGGGGSGGGGPGGSGGFGGMTPNQLLLALVRCVQRLGTWLT